MYDIISRTVKRIKNIYQIIFFTLAWVFVPLTVGEESIKNFTK